ncbi:MAG: cytochrome c5 family protein [Porticoccus sp.]|nr:cytochrome c5 family protein [Porticoccus sp.]PCJ90567.1 MAG: cytochrome c5 family protein [Porticoccaceae bacterium]
MNHIKKIGFIAVALTLVFGLVGCSSDTEELKLTAQQEAEMSERLAPAGEIVLEKDVASAAPVASVSSGPRSGEDVFKTKCTACHSSGAAGAPKVGVAAAWADRIAQGMDTLYANAINGIRGMPAKGLCMDCSDDEMKAAVDYILDQN